MLPKKGRKQNTMMGKNKVNKGALNEGMMFKLSTISRLTLSIYLCHHLFSHSLTSEFDLLYTYNYNYRDTGKWFIFDLYKNGF